MNDNQKLLKLKYWRLKLGLDQLDMARIIGCGRANYCQKENGKAKLYLSEAILILDTFNKMLAKMEQPVLTLDQIFLD